MLNVAELADRVCRLPPRLRNELQRRLEVAEEILSDDKVLQMDYAQNIAMRLRTAKTWKRVFAALLTCGMVLLIIGGVRATLSWLDGSNPTDGDIYIAFALACIGGAGLSMRHASTVRYHDPLLPAREAILKRWEALGEGRQSHPTLCYLPEVRKLRRGFEQYDDDDRYTVPALEREIAEAVLRGVERMAQLDATVDVPRQS